MNSGRNKPLRIFVWGSSLPAVLAASFLYFPHVLTGPVFCPMALILGMPCPGCGLTRAFCFASHGHFAAAFNFHPLWPLILAYFGFLWIVQILDSVRGEPPKLPAYRIAGAATIVLLGFWAVRLAWFFSHGGLAVMARENAVARLMRLF